MLEKGKPKWTQTCPQMEPKCAQNSKKNRCHLTDNCCRMIYEATRRSMAALQLYGLRNIKFDALNKHAITLPS